VALALLTTAAVVLGGAGLATLALERRLATVAPGGVELAALHYNPFTGRLALAGVRARDAAGRELFRAEAVDASVRPLALLVGSLRLARVRVETPWLTLRSPGALTTALPFRVEDLVARGGGVVLDHGRGAPVRAHGLGARLSRLAGAAGEQADVAFAVEATVYGALVHLTGQPRAGGYALHVRARGLDVGALARDFPGRGLDGLRSGRGEVDAVLLLTDDRLLATGHARVTDAVLTLPVRGRPRVRVPSLTIVADGFDPTSGAGRITRVEVVRPSLAMPAASAAPALAALAGALRDAPELVLRRVAVTDGRLALTGAGAVRLERVQVAARAPERREGGLWDVSASAALGRGAAVALDGVLTRELGELDAAVRAQGVRLDGSRAPMGAAAGWDARVSFDGRLRATAGAGGPAVTLTGHAVLTDVTAPAASRALRDLEVRLEPDGDGVAHLQLSASAADGRRVAASRRVPYAASGTPLVLMLGAFQDAVRMATAPP
jgi:hypothetical protein